MIVKKEYIIGYNILMFFNKFKLTKPLPFFSFLKRHKIIAAICIIAIITAAIIFRPKAKKEISVEKISRGNIIQSISITGNIAAERYADMTFQIPGTLATLSVQKGDTVNKGQIIATLDQRTALKNLKTALLNYSLQRNTFEQTYKGQPAEKPNDALNENMKRLLENNQYNLDLAVNSVELQDLARQQSILTAPINGIITRADVKTPGVNITAVTTFTIVDPESITFRMEVDEADISKVKEGQRIDANLDAYPDSTLHLKVDSIDFVTHSTSTGGNAYDVKATMPKNPNYEYRIGMGGNASIITNQKNGILKIPLSSLLDDNTVFIKVGDTYQKKRLTLGIQSDTETEVLSGISEGDLLVLDPATVNVVKK